MDRIALIAIGGACGALSRYWLAGWAQSYTGSHFPVGTLLVNLLGCFLIGIAAAVVASPSDLPEAYRVGFIVGFLGGLTTFSSYVLEIYGLIASQRWVMTALYMAGSNVMGVAGVWLGFLLAERWT